MGFAHAVAFEGDAVSIVDQAIEDGIGDGRLPDHFARMCNRQLSSDQCGFSLVAPLEDLEEVAALLFGQPVTAPAIERQ